jgi:hypothetical protein
MFHAQMRLSLDGCRKLSNFLMSSSRVRALSLSHNFLGDDGGREKRVLLVYTAIQLHNRLPFGSGWHSRTVVHVAHAAVFVLFLSGF